MSSTFSFDNWEQLLESLPAPLPSASSMLAPTPSSASTGEFHPFVAVGLSVSGGGGIEKFFCCCMEDTLGISAVVSLAPPNFVYA
jgi:hypothetical protein